MAGKFVEVVDAAGVTRTVRAVDAREIEAVAKGEPVVLPVPPVADENADPNAFPKDFPGASVFEREGIGHHAALRMTRDELIEVKGIGEKLADEILKVRQG